eukprot:gene1296-1469_t
MPPDDIMAGYYNLTLTLINDGSGNFDSSTGIARMFTWHNPFFISAPWNSNNFDSTLLGTVFSLALFPAVTSVTPAAGSIAGGTLVTINGFGFSNLPLRLTVYVAGVLCDIQSASNNFITCVTRKSTIGNPQSLVSPYTNKFINDYLILNSTRSFGSPGWWVKMWNYNDYQNNRVGNDAYVEKSFGWRDNMCFSLYNYFGADWPTSLKFPYSYWNYFFAADLASSVVVPYTGYYTFYVCSWGEAELYLSYVGVGDSETLLVVTYEYCYDPDMGGKSSPSKGIALIKGQRIYLRLRCVNTGYDLLQIGLKIDPQFDPLGNLVDEFVPTSMPTGVPTGSPSAQPSGHQTYQPTGQPCTQPSRMPTGQPSGIAGQPS